MNIVWQTGKPDESCSCFIKLADHIELAWYSKHSFGGCWYKYIEHSCVFEDFIEDDDIECWIKAAEIARFLQE